MACCGLIQAKYAGSGTFMMIRPNGQSWFICQNVTEGIDFATLNAGKDTREDSKLTKKELALLIGRPASLIREGRTRWTLSV
jgi:hypothetical protein